MGMLQSGERGQQEAAVAALASLADGNLHVAAAIAAVDGSVPGLQGLLRDRDPGIRLLAAACLVQLLRYDHEPSSNQVRMTNLLIGCFVHFTLSVPTETTQDEIHIMI